MQHLSLLSEASKALGASIEIIGDENINNFHSNSVGFLPNYFIITNNTETKEKLDNDEEYECIKVKIRISQGFDRYHYYGNNILSSPSSSSNEKKVLTIDMMKDLTKIEMLSKLKNAFLLPLLGREQEVFSFLGIDSNARNMILQYVDPIELFRMRRVCKVVKTMIDDDSKHGIFSVLARLNVKYFKNWAIKIGADWDYENYGEPAIGKLLKLKIKNVWITKSTNIGYEGKWISKFHNNVDHIIELDDAMNRSASLNVNSYFI